MKAIDLRTQGLVSPLGIGADAVMLSYQLSSGVQGASQSAYRILAASSCARLSAQDGDLWDSGKVLSERCFGIAYAGVPLCSRQRVYWKVMVWDQDDRPSEWSEPACFEVGLCHAADWEGAWIGEGDDTDADQAASPYLAGEFTVDNLEDMVRARAYISGLGLFIASLNGTRLSDTWFDPGESDATQTVYYVTCDILPLLREGCNVLGLQLGNGQYTGYRVNPVMQLPDGTLSPHHRYQKNDSCYVKPGICGRKKALVQVEAEYRDGARKTLLVTDEGWRMHPSPVTFQNWYGGEDYDATLETDGWDTPEADRSAWQTARRMAAPTGRLTAREYPPIVTCEEREAAAVTRLGEGHYLVDFGSNGAGVPVLMLYGTDASVRGRRITMDPAEILLPDSSGVDQRSCTQSWSERYDCVIRDSYRIRGTGQESYTPRFCYHGFRYLEVRGFPGEADTSNFAVKRLRAGNDKRGAFSTSDERVNRICEMTERSIESNMFFTFTDCPQIEKLGWIETSHLMFRSLASGYDIRAWMKKILHDMGDAQLDKGRGDAMDTEDDGFVPGIIPEFYRIGGLYRDLNWNGACIFTPWEYYQWYGDLSVLEQAWPVMERYLAYLAGKEENGLIAAAYAQMGEWGEYGEHTPVILVENCAYYRMHRIMEQAARLLDKPEAALAHAQKAADLQAAFHGNPACYQADTGVYGTGSQASYGCALFSGIVPETEVSHAAAQLAEAVERNGCHLTSGEVGLKQVLTALAEHGYDDVAWRMVMNPTPPSYRFFVDEGLTTLPEYWNYEELWHGMVRSRNHAMMGHVREWMSCSLLGMRQVKPAWQEVVIAPYAPEGMTFAEGSICTPYGDLSVRWQRRDDAALTVRAEVPPGMRIRYSRLENGEVHSCTAPSGVWSWDAPADRRADP